MTTAKQPGSQMCFVCGVKNPSGLHIDIWMDDEHVWTDFTPGQQFQGWPGVLHGGIQATLLDEIMGRVAFLRNQWMVTVKMEMTYRKPVPLDQPLKVIAYAEEWHGRRMVARGEIRLPDGSVAVEARGLYLRVPEQQKETLLSALSAQGIDVSVYR